MLGSVHHGYLRCDVTAEGLVLVIAQSDGGLQMIDDLHVMLSEQRHDIRMVIHIAAGGHQEVVPPGSPYDGGGVGGIFMDVFDLYVIHLLLLGDREIALGRCQRYLPSFAVLAIHIHHVLFAVVPVVADEIQLQTVLAGEFIHGAGSPACPGA